MFRRLVTSDEASGRKLIVRKRHQFVFWEQRGPGLPCRWFTFEGNNGFMCEKCAKLEKRIGRYREVADRTLDKSALESIALLIERCEAQRRELHAERKVA